jgi:hypothetical protein
LGKITRKYNVKQHLSHHHHHQHSLSLYSNSSIIAPTYVPVPIPVNLYSSLEEIIIE